MADIIGVRVTPTLDTLYSFIICNEIGGQSDPALAFDGVNYIVVWSDTRFSGVFEWITAARLTSEGIVLDSSYCIGDHMNSECFPAIACGDSTALVVWHRKFYGICARVLDHEAQPIDSVFRIDSTRTSLTPPAIAFGDSTFFVVWADFNQGGTDLDIFGQILAQDGTGIGNKCIIADRAVNECEPSIAFDGEHYIVVWRTDSMAVNGRLVAADGQLIGDLLRVSDTTAQQRQYPSVCSGTTNYLVSWSEWHNDFDIYGNVDIPLTTGSDLHKAPVATLPTLISCISGFKRFLPCDIYDVQGRRTDATCVTAGIYFIVRDDRTVAKVIVLN